MLVCMALILVLCVGATIGLTVAFFGDSKSGSTEIKLGASIEFDGENGVSVATSDGLTVVPSQTVDVETTLVVKNGTDGDPTSGVLKVIPSLKAGSTGAKLTLTAGSTYDVTINGTKSTDTVMVVYNGDLYLAEKSNTANLKVFTPTTSGTTIKFTVPITFPNSLGNSASGQKCTISMKGVVIQSQIHGESGEVPTTIVDFIPYFEELAPTENLYELSEDGKYITFGSFPQTIKSDDVTITSSTPDSDGYYLGSDGERYAKVTINYTEEDAELLDMSWDDLAAYKMNVASDGTAMQNGSDYYFKVEPIKWRILSNSDGTALITSDTILQGMAYQSNHTRSGSDYYATDTSGNILTDNGVQVYANNYKWSELRSFLTGDFYEKSFTSEQKSLIQLTTVDNSKNTTTTNNSGENPYTCEDTNDYVFALSYADLINTSYGFNSDRTVSDSARIWSTSDYAKATKAITYTKEFIEAQVGELDPTNEEHAVYIMLIDRGIVWLRSPYCDGSYIASDVLMGSGIGLDGVDYPVFGAVPALQLSL